MYANAILSLLPSKSISIDFVCPPIFMFRFAGRYRFLQKWLGYIDKYILFPPLLFYYSRRYDIVHICDHSNAVYSCWVGNTPCLITCHDLLAVRGAFGDRDAYCECTFFGRLLQRSILASLRHAKTIAFVSRYTYSDFVHLAKCCNNSLLSIIPNPLNAPFTSDCNDKALCIAYPNVASSRFLLIVGSSLPRKNRESAIRLLAYMGSNWTGSLVFAGAPLSASQKQLASELNLLHRIHEVVSPTHELLNCLYVRAFALLFPSFSEGFGWPIIEAQQCECPVICSNVTAVPEIAGDGAIVTDPTDLAAMAAAVISLEDQELRSKLLARGRANLSRFDPKLFVSAYRDLYHKTLSVPCIK